MAIILFFPLLLIAYKYLDRYTAAAAAATILLVQLMKTVRISSFSRKVYDYLVVAVSLAAGELHMLELLSRFVTTVVQEEYHIHIYSMYVKEGNPP